MPKAQIITTSQIAERAFEIWEAEGKPHGLDQDHWIRAESELNALMARMSPARAGRKPAAKALAKPLAKPKAQAKPKADAMTEAAPKRVRTPKAVTA